MTKAFGLPMKRREDPQLVSGHGRYAGDVSLPGQLYMAVVRSPLAHARIASIDRSAAAQPGVAALYTAADLDLGPNLLIETAGPPDVIQIGRPVLAEEVVRYSGEAVAVVVAETRYRADDAAGEVYVDFEPLPAVAGVDNATSAGAPAVHEHYPGNVVKRAANSFGDWEAAFRDAPVTVSRRFVQHRVCGAAMEPRAVTAAPFGKGVKIWTSTQHVYGVRDHAAAFLRLPVEDVVVVAENVGGGFGPKGRTYPEEMLCAFAALKLGRPVQWVATRGEDTATTVHGHGDVLEVELAAEADGRLRGLRGHLWHDLGAYASIGALIAENVVVHMLSGYRLPAFHVEYELCFTNAAPTGTVRGGGRPQGNFVVERMMDLLAQRLGVDATELRRRNLIQPSQMPYDTGHRRQGAPTVYDSGDYPALIDTAQRLATAHPVRPGVEPGGTVVGVGLAFGVEGTGIGNLEPVKVTVLPDGLVEVALGSSPGGQGHLTMAAQIVADRLGWPIERVRVTAGDTTLVPDGGLTAGSRSAVHVGNAASLSARRARAELLRRASERLEADPSDLDLEDAVVAVHGAPASKLDAVELLDGEPLEVMERFETGHPTVWASGCHIASVRVDPLTGKVEVVDYAIAHDSGNEINPRMVEGQLHGGLMHGFGYALMEEALYDPEGTFLSSTFLDYSIPSFPDFPVVADHLALHSHSEANPEGVKGAGESSSIISPAAVAAAVEDALRRLGSTAVVDRIPITPEQVLNWVGER